MMRIPSGALALLALVASQSAATASAQDVQTVSVNRIQAGDGTTRDAVPLQLPQDQGQLLLRFQLIEASTQNLPRDPAIAAVDSVLRDLFRFNGYKLLSQAAVTMGIQASYNSGRGGTTGSSTRTATQMLSGMEGKTYELHARVTTSWGQPPVPVTMSVEVALYDVTAPSAGDPSARAGTPPGPIPTNKRLLLSSSVGIAPGRTIVIGSTQPAGPGSALILTVRPEIRN